MPLPSSKRRQRPISGPKSQVQGSARTRVLRRRQPLPHSPHIPAPSSLVSIPPQGSHDGALSQIESLLESILDAVINGADLVIPYQTARSSPGVSPAASGAGGARQMTTEVVKFPGRNIQEVKRFDALLRILELSHEALLTGNLITKRNIYYQNTELFRSQSAVNDMVDNLAFTLGVGRGDLNIVAAARGLIAGPIDVMMRNGATVHYGHGLSGGNGNLIPPINSVDKVDFHNTRWLLVIEKEATFRTLANSGYSSTSRAGHGILVTAKGFPDLVTRRFLSTLHSVRPQLNVFALVDFDPHGVSILRTFQYGSQRLDHEENVTLPHLKWLGIRSLDIMSRSSIIMSHSLQDPQSGDSQTSQEFSSQGSLAYPLGSSDDERPAKRPKYNYPRDSNESVAPLTRDDRKKAVSVMKQICGERGFDSAGLEQMQELQRMLMLNVKAEIQTVDNFGDIADWLDERLSV
ncbi:Spo11/DNA topoisomerase VI subunit A [Lasiosphaeria miniovina]|uniref:DNA topoisomerase (ATP-hydrolyzing) n=1 Tax=Lasiosphaeria miniovina TaxID=1954250 RepID=A0AA40E5C4_9PEZI|nr:Spo11/DNA topoisomerase VI subunit A [Lasiosphaeria miniovina]KAK0727730.1 Spo11/DNA topoisomerase VI subunit A [Lasiosphaeria miniovina]